MTPLGRATLIAAVPAAILFATLLVLTELYLSPEGLAPFDARLFGYSSDEADAYLAALAASGGTALYLGLFRALDTVFPLLLTLAFLGALWVNTHGFWRGVRLVFVICPLVYLTADLWENARVAQILTVGLPTSPEYVALTSMVTRAKWAAVLACWMLILVCWRRQLRRKER